MPINLHAPPWQALKWFLRVFAYLGMALFAYATYLDPSLRSAVWDVALFSNLLLLGYFWRIKHKGKW